MAEQSYGVGHNWRRELEDTQIRLRFARHVIDDQADRIARLEVALAKEEWTVMWTPVLGVFLGLSFTAITVGNYVGGIVLAAATVVILVSIAFRRRQIGKSLQA